MDMDYKAVRWLGFFSLCLSVVFVAVWLWYLFSAGSSAAAFVQVMWLVFGLQGAVATRVASILDAQAEEFADLRRLLAERPGMNSEA